MQPALPQLRLEWERESLSTADAAEREFCKGMTLERQDWADCTLRYASQRDAHPSFCASDVAERRNVMSRRSADNITKCTKSDSRPRLEIWTNRALRPVHRVAEPAWPRKGSVCNWTSIGEVETGLRLEVSNFGITEAMTPHRLRNPSQTRPRWSSNLALHPSCHQQMRSSRVLASRVRTLHTAQRAE